MEFLPVELIMEIAFRCDLSDITSFLEAFKFSYKPNNFFWINYCKHNDYTDSLIAKLDFVTYRPEIDYTAVNLQLVELIIVLDRLGILSRLGKIDKLLNIGIFKFLPGINTLLINAYNQKYYEVINFLLYHNINDIGNFINYMNYHCHQLTIKDIEIIFLHPNMRKYGPFSGLNRIKSTLKSNIELSDIYWKRLTRAEKSKKLIKPDEIKISVNQNMPEDIYNTPSNNITYYTLCSDLGIIEMDTYYNDINYESVYIFLNLISDHVDNFQEGVDYIGYIYTKVVYIFHLAKINDNKHVQNVILASEQLILIKSNPRYKDLLPK